MVWLLTGPEIPRKLLWRALVKLLGFHFLQLHRLRLSQPLQTDTDKRPEYEAPLSTEYLLVDQGQDHK